MAKTPKKAAIALISNILPVHVVEGLTPDGSFCSLGATEKVLSYQYTPDPSAVSILQGLDHALITQFLNIA